MSNFTQILALIYLSVSIPIVLLGGLAAISKILLRIKENKNN